MGRPHPHLGKIAVPPEILNKKGKPSAAEWTILQNHPLRGAELVAPVGEWVHAVGGHHERWDGTGYPHKLAGHDIPRVRGVTGDSCRNAFACGPRRDGQCNADSRHAHRDRRPSTTDG